MTGGAGFLGSHLCRVLLNRGDEVICMDNLLSGKHSNIEPLLERDTFEFIQCDITENNDVKFWDPIDEIYNLACPASPIRYQEDPIATMKTSVQGSINMLDMACRKNAKILQASTSEIYGEPLNHPQNEDDWGNVNPIGIRSCYDVGKRAAECLFNDYHREFGIESKIVRIFNTYGPKMDKNDGRVVSNFINQALNNRDITIYGDGSQTRSFCYRDDLIEGMIKVMDEVKGPWWPVNLGNPNEITIKQLADLIIDMTHSKSEIKFEKLPEDDPTRRKPDIQRAYDLGWSPSVDIQEGLQRTINWFSSVGLHS